MISLSFFITSYTRLGEGVYLAGNIAELGGWNSASSLKLTTNKNIYPEWTTTHPIKVPPEVPLEFKMLVKDSFGSVIRWEDIKGNRTIVASQPIAISFEEGKPEIKTEMVGEPIESIPYRKNTSEILHDLSDQASSSSSGNERQYWIEMNSKRNRKGSFRIDNFLVEARKVFKTWKTEENRPEAHHSSWRPFPKMNHLVQKPQQAPEGAERTQRKTKMAQDETGNGMKNSPSLVQRELTPDTQEITAALNTNINTALNMECVMVQHLSYQNGVLSLEEGSQMRSTSFIVVHLDSEEEEHYRLLLDQCHALVVSQTSIIEKFLIFCAQNRIDTRLRSQESFLIHKKNQEKCLLLFLPTIQGIKSIEHNPAYFELIEKEIAQEKLFDLPPRLRAAMLMAGDPTIASKDSKYCLVVGCKKISGISQKVINKLIGIAGRPRLEVYVITEDSDSEIRKRLSASEKDKLFVMNQQGVIQSPNQKLYSIFQELRTSKDSYLNCFAQLRAKIDVWTTRKLLQLEECDSCLEFRSPRSATGSLIASYICKEVSRHNLSQPTLSLHCSQFQHGDNIHVTVRPLVSSSLFYCKTIASMNSQNPKQSIFYCFDFGLEEGTGGVGAQMVAECQRKGIRAERFKVGMDGIDDETVLGILSQVLVETYSRSQAPTEFGTPNTLKSKQDTIKR